MLEFRSPTADTTAVVLVAEDVASDYWLAGIAANGDGAPSHTIAFVSDRDDAEEIARLLTDPTFWPEAHDGTVDWEAWATHWLTDIAPDAFDTVADVERVPA